MAGSWQQVALYAALTVCVLALCIADATQALQDIPRKRIFCNPIGCMTNKRGEDNAQPQMLWPPTFGQSKRSQDKSISREYRKLIATLASNLPDAGSYSPQDSPALNNLEKQDLLQLLLAAHSKRSIRIPSRQQRGGITFEVPAGFPYSDPAQPIV